MLRYLFITVSQTYHLSKCWNDITILSLVHGTMYSVPYYYELILHKKEMAHQGFKYANGIIFYFVCVIILYGSSTGASCMLGFVVPLFIFDAINITFP